MLNHSLFSIFKNIILVVEEEQAKQTQDAQGKSKGRINTNESKKTKFAKAVNTKKKKSASFLFFPTDTNGSTWTELSDIYSFDVCAGLWAGRATGDHRRLEDQEWRGPECYSCSFKQSRRRERFGDLPADTTLSLSAHLGLCFDVDFILFFPRCANSTSELMREHLKSQQPDQFVEYRQL